MADLVRTSNGPELIANLVGDGPGASQAQHAVAAALSLAARLPVIGNGGAHSPRSACSSRTSAGCRPPEPGVLAVSSSEFRAAKRLDALPPAARRAWFAQHLPALRAEQITLAQLP
jgi:hypothetical protein